MSFLKEIPEILRYSETYSNPGKPMPLPGAPPNWGGTGSYLFDPNAMVQTPRAKPPAEMPGPRNPNWHGPSQPGIVHTKPRGPAGRGSRIDYASAYRFYSKKTRTSRKNFRKRLNLKHKKKRRVSKKKTKRSNKKSKTS